MDILIIRHGKEYLARHCERGKKKEAMGRQCQRVDLTGLSRVAEGCGRQTEMKAAGCERIGRFPTTLLVKGQIDR